MEIYATDGQYCLVPLTIEDKDNFIELRRQIADTPQYYNTPEKVDVMWKVMTEGEDTNYSIYDENGEYCGNIILQSPKSDTPEIGVDLIESKRNQGIAARTIRLLAKQAYQELDVDYFVLRVSSTNLHCRHMVKKLGAVLIGEEESETKRIIQSMKESLGEEVFVKMLEQIPQLINKCNGEDEVILRYQLTPTMLRE